MIIEPTAVAVGSTTATPQGGVPTPAVVLPSEGLAGMGLVLMMGAVIAVVIGVASFGSGALLLAMLCCAAGVSAFVLSLTCFLVDGHRAAAADRAAAFAGTSPA